jgi:predicted RNase H-like HicB family nuclease
MYKKEIKVDAFWDDEVKVWVASSEDVSGLITEAETTEQLVEKLKIIIPELLVANGQIDNEDNFDIPLHLISTREELIKRQA